MLLKKAYYYFYYQLYKSTNTSSIFSRSFRASLYLDILFILIGFSGLNIYGTFIEPGFDIGNGSLGIILYIVFVLIPNYFIFEHKDQWKYIVNEFDKLPKKTNQAGRLISYSIVTLIVASFIFSIYLMDQNAKANHTGPYSKEYLENERIKDSILNQRHKN